MRLVITSGATFEKWDDVRGITNKSKGTTGARIAEEALLRGHFVDYISTDITKKPFEITITPKNIDAVEKLKSVTEVYDNYTFHKAQTFNDYLNNCLSLTPSNEKMVFVSTAAVSDYAPEQVNGKISSDKDSILLEMKRLPKVIKKVKEKYPLMPVVGFKLLSEESSISDLVDIAYKSLLENRMSLIVANLVDKDFKPTKTFIITPEKNIIPVSNRNDLPSLLITLIEDRFDCDYGKTEIVGSFPNNVDITKTKELLEDCANYSLFTPYGEGRKGAEFGAVAVRSNNGMITTGRGSKKKALSIDDLAFVKEVSENKIILESNGTKATLNASTLFEILKNRPEINYVVHSHVYLSNGVFVSANGAAPGTKKDYEIIKSAIENGETIINQEGHGCFILLKDKKDLLSALLSNGLYESPYSKYYDIAYYRFKSGSLEEGVKSLNLPKESKVLDLACGTGKSTKELMSIGFKSVDFADKSKDMLSVAEQRLNRKGTVASFEDLRNIKETYDLITVRQALSYINPSKTLDFIKGVSSVLNKNGCLVFNTFKDLESSVNTRFDSFEIENGFIKTFETNIITKEKVIHSQRTEYLSLNESTYIPLYDINQFNQLNLSELKNAFQLNGFEVEIVTKNKSVCFIARKV